jgi:radical SAM superfamily enzyme YgiQ (UPF0313 family)
MKNNYTVGSAQINNGFAGQYYLPYAIGTLVSYFNKFSNNSKKFKFELPIYKRLLLEECVEKLLKCNIVLFSTYVWNINISKAIAKELKKKNKECFIIFGGPSVPDRSESFLRENNYIDCCIHQEGERTITTVLDNIENDQWRNVHGISFIKNEKYYSKPPLPKMTDISILPSPYLGGFFDELIKKNPQEKWLALWETNRGCPFSCAFCDWGSATASKVSRMDMEKLEKELLWFANNKIEFIYVCDANFGILPRDYEIAEMAIKIKKKTGYPHVLSVQTTKNARERSYKIQKLLYEGGMHKSVNLAMQSLNMNTLREIKRDNISIDDYKVLQQKFLKDGIPTYSDLIIGLPGDTFDSFQESVDQLIQVGQHNRIQFNNLSILPNAEMASPEYVKKNEILTVESPIVNMHGSLDENPKDGILEKQNFVKSTKSMPTHDWIKTRVFATGTEFYYFNKIAQFPILILTKLSKNKFFFKDIIHDLLSINKNPNFPIISELNRLFYNHAENITKGGAEFIYSKYWLKIFWPPGEFGILELIFKNNFNNFYNEILNFFDNKYFDKIENIEKKLIKDATIFNRDIFCQPEQNNKKHTIELSFNIRNIFTNGQSNEDLEIEKNSIKTIYSINKKGFSSDQEWAQKIIWYGHRRGSYLNSYDIIK